MKRESGVVTPDLATVRGEHFEPDFFAPRLLASFEPPPDAGAGEIAGQLEGVVFEIVFLRIQRTDTKCTVFLGGSHVLGASVKHSCQIFWH